MATFGWVLLAGAFLMLIMIANNSWPWVWSKISRGVPKPGEGNLIVPNPPEGANPFQPPPSSGITPGTIVPNPPQGANPFDPTVPFLPPNTSGSTASSLPPLPGAGTDPVPFNIDQVHFRVFPALGTIEQQYVDGTWHLWVAAREESQSQARNILAAAHNAMVSVLR